MENDTTLRRSYITTKDNPYNPETQYKDWWQFDMAHGYNTCALLARTLEVMEFDEDKYDSLTSAERNALIDGVIDGIIANDPEDIYIKVFGEPMQFI